VTNLTNQNFFFAKVKVMMEEAPLDIVLTISSFIQSCDILPILQINKHWNHQVKQKKKIIFKKD